MKQEQSTEVGLGRCSVCGDTPQANVVKCGSCETVYHRECFLWMGRCSIMGCGLRRAIEIDEVGRECGELLAPHRTNDDPYVINDLESKKGTANLSKLCPWPRELRFRTQGSG